MKKILHLTGTLDRGGIENLLLDIAKNNNLFEGYVMHLVSSKGGALENEIKNTGIDYSLIKRKHKFDFKFILQIRKYIVKNEISLIHVHEPILAFHLILATLSLKCKRIFSVHGHMKFNSVVFLFISKYYDSIIFVSNAVKTFALNQLKGSKYSIKFKVVYNGIDMSKFNVVSGNIKDELHLPSENILLGMVGNFNSGRDQETICRALPKIIQNNPAIYFAFIGAIIDPDKYNRCHNLCRRAGIENNVFFLEARSDIPTILRSLDLFVYSSYNDTFGIAVIEAMASELPVIVNDLEVFKEITIQGEMVYLFKKRDAENLYEIINYVLFHPELARKKAKAAKEYVLKTFRIQSHIAGLLAIYK